jgi:histidine ammonia-lyase
MIVVSEKNLGIIEFDKIVRKEEEISISESCIKLLCKGFEKIRNHSINNIVYGINTGFGPMAQFYIPPDEHIQLQYNLIRSHASGSGNALDYESCRALILVRLKTLSLGNSGVRPELIKLLADFLNYKIHPFIPIHGGVGASGDLVQLAHLALNLIGEGELIVDGKRRNCIEILKEKGISPIQLQGREGLAIINGTAVMTGIGLLNCIHAKTLLSLSIYGSSFINELMESHNDHFSIKLNELKQHPGQQEIAREMNRILHGSPSIKNSVRDSNRLSKKFTNKIQEYYSLRCIPQILGPITDTINNAQKVLVDELNSVSDNPVIDKNFDEILHGGNFHGDYVSFEMDKLKIAITKLSILSERQINYLAADYLNEKFPKFLNGNKQGLNFGIQGIQFTATSTVAENQTLSNPMYIHSIPTNSDNQDVVSMGTNAALLTSKVIDNSFQVLAILWISLMRAYYLKENSIKTGEITSLVINAISKHVPKPNENDEPLYHQIELLHKAYKNENWNIF